MYNIEFYEKNGKSEIWDLLESLRKKATSNKNARIQHNQISLYIQLLQNNGTRMTANVVKYLNHGIWELRPGNNRILFFYYGNGTFVLLHHFRKKTQKTPQKEIDQALKEIEDYMSGRKSEHENLERLQATCKRH